MIETSGGMIVIDALKRGGVVVSSKRDHSFKMLRCNELYARPSDLGWRLWNNTPERAEIMDSTGTLAEAARYHRVPKALVEQMLRVGPVGMLMLNGRCRVLRTWPSRRRPPVMYPSNHTLPHRHDPMWARLIEALTR